MGDYSRPAPCVIFDIDGTLADAEHRRHFVMNGNHDWASFYAHMHLDPVIEPIRGLCNMYFMNTWDVFLFTARPERFRVVTEQWLHRKGVFYTQLFMRPDADQSLPDDVVKSRMHDALNRDVHLVVDDRQKVVNMWRAKGLLCLQCAPGAF